MYGTRQLDDTWSVLISDAGAWQVPADIPHTARALPAPVPGTVAQALELAGRFDRTNPVRLDDRDFWYVTEINSERGGPAMLRLDGLATIAEVYWNGVPVLASTSMFRSYAVPVTITGRDHLAIAFRALAPHLNQPAQRGRWRPQAITPPGLRAVRTTLIGRMPGLGPEIDVIGPFRAITLSDGETEIDDLRMRAWLGDNRTGIIEVSFVFSGRASQLALRSGDGSVPVLVSADGRLHARLEVPQARLWWPNGMGEPALYPVELVIDERILPLGKTGFRTIAVDRGLGDEFALIVNGVKMFCRGTQWDGADPVSLAGTDAAMRPLLTLAQQAHMNMLRVPATASYQTPAFHALCDELGLLVWQDFMFAQMDYPADDPGFLADVAAEARDLLAAIQFSPSLAVLCGGSGVISQAFLSGLEPASATSPLFDDLLPGLVREWRPDVAYIAHAPDGGPVPFAANHGVSHYHGIGLLGRKMNDARLADVRFAAESLMLSHVPGQHLLDMTLAVPAVHDPRWKAGVPRQRGASWDFEDMRDLYLAELHDVDPARLRREDPVRYLDMSRAVTVDMVESVIGEWRRAGSACNGALIGRLADVVAGAGAGFIDTSGQPKPVWHAVRRAFRPVQAMLVDEGTNGLDVHVVNDTDHALDLILELTTLKDGRTKTIGGAARFRLAARQMQVYSATDLFGQFFDTTYAFRFAPPEHDVTVARLMLANRPEIGIESYHFPRGRKAAMGQAGLAGEPGRDDKGWFVMLTADRLAQSVHLRVDGWQLSDNWFHLAPGRPKRIDLKPDASTPSDAKPSGDIASLSVPMVLHFEA